jgi:general secretion pathway protein C
VKRATFVAAACAAGAVCVAGLYRGGQPPAPPPAAAPVPAAPAPAVAAAVVPAAAPARAPAVSMRLMGVIEHGPDSVALLAVDGGPAHAVGVGAQAAPGVTVREVHQGYVLLDAGGTVRRVDVSASPAIRPDAVAAAPAAATPARAAPAPKSGGAMPLPAVNPELMRTHGQTAADQQAAQMEEQMRQVEQMRQSQRRPAGIGPAAFGAQPSG